MPDKGTETDSEYGDMLDMHRKLVLWLFIPTLCLILALSFIVYAIYKEIYEIPSSLIVVLAGALGGFVSSLNRIYSSQDIFPLLRFRNLGLWKKENIYLIIYSFIPSLVGAVGAMVVYEIFAGGMLKGPLFPEFHASSLVINGTDCGTPDKCRDAIDTFGEYVKYWRPRIPEDYAKLLVWGFIAGFSERFVPDILNKISSNREQKDYS